MNLVIEHDGERLVLSRPDLIAVIVKLAVEASRLPATDALEHIDLDFGAGQVEMRYRARCPKVHY